MQQLGGLQEGGEGSKRESKKRGRRSGGVGKGSKEKRRGGEEGKEEEENEEGRHTTTETVVGGLPPSLELQCTLILLLTVQSTMSLRMAGRILEKFLYTSTRHPNLGRGNSVKNRHYHVL